MTDAVEAGLDRQMVICEVEDTDAVVLRVREPNLNYATADDLKAWLHQAVSRLYATTDKKRFVFSLKNVRVLDSSGLAMIIFLKKRVEMEGGALILCEMNDLIRRLFELTGLRRAFTIAGTEAEAVAGE